MAYHPTQTFLSSPDPLNDTLTFSSPAKPPVSSIRRSLPLSGGSPRKQTFQLDVGDQLSPQKIRVTVEAEHSEEKRNNGQRGGDGRDFHSPVIHRAPTVRQSVRTTTTTVPVKGLSDSEDESYDSASKRPTRGRGRPRKSISTPIPAKSRNRAVTPAARPSPRPRRTLGHLVDGDDSEDWDFAIGAGVEMGRGKGRSRSRSVKGTQRSKSTPVAKQIGSPDRVISSTTSRKGRGRRKTLAPEEIIIHEDDIDLAHDIGISSDNQGLNTEGVLAQRDMNLVPTHSADVTDRLTTTMEDDNPPFQHGKFSPAKKTPTKAGISAPRASSANLRCSTGSLVDKFSRETRLPVEFHLKSPSNGEASHSVVQQSGQEDENEIEEMREFDTILESEGFSMISVDSVPSLREHLSSPYGPNQIGPGSEQTIATMDVGPLENDKEGCDEDSFSSIAPEILEAATPRKKASNPLLRAVLSANRSGDGDSFSSIPPEILQAATPGKQVEAATIESNTRPMSNENSKPAIKLAVVAFPQSLEAGRRSLTSSGLLTPNETPSPIEAVLPQPGGSNNEPLALYHSEPKPCDPPLPEESSAANSQMRSSPPSAAPGRLSYAAPSRPLNSNASHMETPSILFSSPSLPPLIQRSPLERSEVSSRLNPNQPQRQSLSPIVRAGRILQDVAMKSTSRSRIQSLGSPFKSPAAERNSCGISGDRFGTKRISGEPQICPAKSKGKESDLFVGFNDDTRKEPRVSNMMGEELARSQKGGLMAHPIGLAQEEDPFHVGKQSSHSITREEQKEYILELPSNELRLITGLVGEKAQDQDSLHNESAMSWQAGSGILTATPYVHVDTNGNNIVEATELFQQRREAEWARERAAVSSQIESASPSKVIIIESDHEEDNMHLNGKVGNEEEDIWQAEARLSSSTSEEQSAEIPPKPEPLEKQRRGKISNPWKKNSARLVCSDEISQLSSPRLPENIDTLPYNVHVKPRSTPLQITPESRASNHDVDGDQEDLLESSIMWHIPQKSNFTPRPRSSRNLDLSALLGSSPFKRSQPDSQTDPKLQNPMFATSESRFIKSADVELAASSSSTPLTADPQNLNEEYQSDNNSFHDNKSGESTNTSYEESELVSGPFQADLEVTYPILPNIKSPSPQKSCLRTPTSTSPTKFVAFVSPTPSLSPLSATTWSRAHWKLLHAMYDESKSQADPKNGNLNREKDQVAGEPSKYLGKKIQARGARLTLEQWHLDVVREFREVVPGWDEGVVAKRLFAIIVGQDLRRQRKE